MVSGYKKIVASSVRGQSVLVSWRIQVGIERSSREGRNREIIIGKSSTRITYWITSLSIVTIGFDKFKFVLKDLRSQINLCECKVKRLV